MLRLPELLATADWVIPAISAAAGVLGALVGGVAAGWFTLKGEDKRQAFAQKVEKRKEEREDQATLALARGAAREWARVLGSSRASIAAPARRGYWWPSATDVEIFAVHEDRKLVASMLSADEFAFIELAESRLYTAVMSRERLSDGGSARW